MIRAIIWERSPNSYFQESEILRNLCKYQQLFIDLNCWCKIQIIVESTCHLAEILSSEVLYNSKILIVEIPFLVISNYKKMKNNIDQWLIIHKNQSDKHTDWYFIYLLFVYLLLK